MKSSHFQFCFFVAADLTFLQSGKLQVLDLRTWTWSKVEVKSGVESLESPSPLPVPPCAGHSLVSVELVSYFVDVDCNDFCTCYSMLSFSCL